MPFSAAQGDYTHNEEPRLGEMLNELIIRLLMARGGVEVKTLRALLIAAGVHGRLLERDFNSHLRRKQDRGRVDAHATLAAPTTPTAREVEPMSLSNMREHGVRSMKAIWETASTKPLWIEQ